MKTVQAVINFTDLKEGITRQMGDTFICEDERAQDLLSWQFVKVIEEENKPVKTKKKTIKKAR